MVEREVEKFLTSMTVKGTLRDSVTYNVEKIEKAFVLLKKMEDRGIIPNVISYNLILDGFYRQDRVKRKI
ncbi:hypothetical protein RDABS01_003885 [Bienertia sinuspersici]